MRNEAEIIRTEKLGRTVVKALEKRSFEAYYCATKEEALEQAVKLIPGEASVAWGGSVSINEIGIKDRLREQGNEVIDRDLANSPQERTEMMRKALLCDVFLMGTNALSEDGQLINIDGTGNRVAALTYGPKNVIVFAGVNKIVKTVQDAFQRAHTVAAPINAQRFPNLATPCLKTGACGDCLSDDCICNVIVATRRCSPAKRIKVIVVGEPLGF